MERLTVRKTDIVLFQKDGQYTPPISMNGEQVRKVLERLAELEDAIEQGKLVEVVRCSECKYSRALNKEEAQVYLEGISMCRNTECGQEPVWGNDFCSDGEYRDIAKICLTEDCPYQQGNPCEAAEGCGGYEGAEESFLMQRFMRLE